MSKFKCGDRVRINCPNSMSGSHGKTGTIWKIIPKSTWIAPASRNNGQTGYRVDIDGVGTVGAIGAQQFYFCYVAAELEPLVSPDELAWQKFREHLKPNPAIIFDADPIIVSTDEEAARIAETVPNSHIKVVIRGVVVSEYFGQSQSNRP